MGPHRRGLTIQQKLEVIQYSKETKCSIRALGQIFGISKSSASEILKQESKLLMNAAANGLDTKRIKMSPRGEQMDNMIMAWYREALDDNQILTGPQIQAKALEIAKTLDIPKFQASNGWLSKFKRRHGLSCAANTLRKVDGSAAASATFSCPGLSELNQDPLETLSRIQEDSINCASTITRASNIKTEQPEAYMVEASTSMFASNNEDYDDANPDNFVNDGNRQITNYGEALSCVEALKEFLSRIGHNRALNLTLELEKHFKDITSHDHDR